MAPNTTISTMRAMARPMDSPLRRSSSAILVKSAPSVPCPATWTVKPSPDPSSATVRRSSMEAASLVVRGTEMSAARWSCETSPAAFSGDCAATS